VIETKSLTTSVVVTFSLAQVLRAVMRGAYVGRRTISGRDVTAYGDTAWMERPPPPYGRPAGTHATASRLGGDQFVGNGTVVRRVLSGGRHLAIAGLGHQSTVDTRLSRRSSINRAVTVSRVVVRSSVRDKSTDNTVCRPARALIMTVVVCRQ